MDFISIKKTEEPNNTVKHKVECAKTDGICSKLGYRQNGNLRSFGSNALEYRSPDQRTTVRLTLAKILKHGKSLFKKVCLRLKSGEDHPPDKVLYETYTKVGYVAAFRGRYQI